MTDLRTIFQQLTPDEQAAFATFVAKELPARRQVELVRALADELSFSYGVDRIEAGLGQIESDLDCEDATGMPYLPQYDRRAVSLNPEIWSN